MSSVKSQDSSTIGDDDTQVTLKNIVKLKLSRSDPRQIAFIRTNGENGSSIMAEAVAADFILANSNQTKMSDFVSSISTINGKMAYLEGSVESLGHQQLEDINSLKNTMLTVEKRMTDLDTAFDVMTGEYNPKKLQVEVSEFKEETKREMHFIKDDITSLETDVGESKRLIETTKKDLTEFVKEVRDSVWDRTDKFDDKMKTLQSQFSSLKGQMDTETLVLENNMEKRLQESKKELKEEMKVIRTEADLDRKDLTHLQTVYSCDIKRLNERLSEMENSTKEEVQKLTQIIIEQKEENAKLRYVVEGLIESMTKNKEDMEERVRNVCTVDQIRDIAKSMGLVNSGDVHNILNNMEVICSEDVAELVDDQLESWYEKVNKIEDQTKETNVEMDQLPSKIMKIMDQRTESTLQKVADVYDVLNDKINEVQSVGESMKKEIELVGKVANESKTFLDEIGRPGITGLAVDIKDLKESYNADLLRVERDSTNRFDTIAAELLYKISDVKSQSLLNTTDITDMKSVMENMGGELREMKQMFEKDSIVLCYD